ncbi:DUF4369 domain-containing protein [Chitinophaga caseinilytica]|uniref:DUF4369 domain-containing protein n=1 Tax=Chitinophaga caseinilytica TaxID=2267521 RepID=A0ABZ2Z724_9BACT
MQKLLTLLLGCLCSTLSLHAQGYQITVSFRNLPSGTLYLGHYMGKTTYVMDSAKINDQGTAVLQGKEALPGGIYLIVLPGKQKYFEILLDKKQQFSIQADTADLLANTVFTGSPDNAMFSDYNKFILQNSRELQAKASAARTAADSAALRPLSDAFGKQLQDYRANVISKHPASLLAAIFKAMREPQIPPFPGAPTERPIPPIRISIIKDIIGTMWTWETGASCARPSSKPASIAISSSSWRQCPIP